MGRQNISKCSCLNDKEDFLMTFWRILCQWLYSIATITSGMWGMRSKMKNDIRQCVLRLFLNGWYAFHMEMARHFNAIVRIIRFSCNDEVCVTALYVSIEALEVSIGIRIDLRIEKWQHSTCITETCAVSQIYIVINTNDGFVHKH